LVPAGGAGAVNDKKELLVMSGGQLQVQYETLEASAKQSDNLAASFGSQLKALEQSVAAMVWQGNSGTAFQGYFDKLNKELTPIQDTLHGLAGAIRNSAQRLQQNDQQIASAWHQG
jgi:WXG100 family type VII secretion target